MFDDYESDESSSRSHLSKRKQMAPPGVHIPNSNEGKLLRKIMSETGLTEIEIRQRKIYRKQLADVRKAGETPKTSLNEDEKQAKRFLKMVLRELKLPKEHPKVQEALIKKIEELNLRGWYYKINIQNVNINKVIKNY